MISTLFAGGAPAIGNALAAIAALGTASYGLVDVSKALWNGGPSIIGLNAIKKSLDPFGAALTEGGGREWQDLIKAHWINGMALDDQKAKAMGLIRLGLTSGNAASIANKLDTRVDPATLETAVKKVEAGAPLTETDQNAIGRFIALAQAALDSGYERADQQYRAGARSVACAVAVVLAVLAGALVDTQGASAIKLENYWFSSDFWTAVLIGVVSTPLAPVAKDLASSLNAAVGAFKSAKG
jgi:hypothetical protein